MNLDEQAYIEKFKKYNSAELSLAIEKELLRGSPPFEAYVTVTNDTFEKFLQNQIDIRGLAALVKLIGPNKWKVTI